MQLIKHNNSLALVVSGKTYGNALVELFDGVQERRIRDIALVGSSEVITIHGIERELVSDNQKRRLLVLTEITKVARLYGAAGTIPRDIMDGAIDLVLNGYKLISIDEIYAAFMYGASGRYPVDMSMYGKTFNLEWFSRIMKAWMVFRRKVISDISKEQSSLMMLKSEDVKRREAKEGAKLIIDSIIKAISVARYGDKNRVKASNHWYTLLEKIRYIYVPLSSKRAAMVVARKRLIVKKRRSACSTSMQKQGQRINTMNALKALQNGGAEGEVAVEAKSRILMSWIIRVSRMEVKLQDIYRVMSEKAKEYYE